LSTGQDIVRDLFQTFCNDGHATPKRLLRNEGEEFKQEPLGCGKLKVEDVGMEKHLLEKA